MSVKSLMTINWLASLRHRFTICGFDNVQTPARKSEAFQAWTTEDNTLSRSLDPPRFEFVLPADGQTYLGKQIKIECLVRVRVRVEGSVQDCVKDAKFKLSPARRLS